MYHYINKTDINIYIYINIIQSSSCCCCCYCFCPRPQEGIPILGGLEGLNKWTDILLAQPPIILTIQGKECGLGSNPPLM